MCLTNSAYPQPKTVYEVVDNSTEYLKEKIG